MPKSRLSARQQISTLWSLGGLTIKELARRVGRGINEDDLFDRASTLAFNFILALFPLLIFLFAMFGLFASHSAAMQKSLFVYLTQVLPPAASQVIIHTLQEVTRNAGGTKVTVGIMLTAFFASSGMTSMISGLNAVYEVKEMRSYLKVRLIALGLTLAISLLILFALIGVVAGGWLTNWLASTFGFQETTIIIWRAAQVAAALLFVVFSFSLIYYNGPDLDEQHWYWITPGSVVGVLLSVGASFAFRAYLHFFNTYSKTYGSLGAAMILLMWLYITGFAFLIGGEINAQIEHAAALRGHPEAKAPGQKKAS